MHKSKNKNQKQKQKHNQTTKIGKNHKPNKTKTLTTIGN
jgi:hypothetical protein